MEEETGAQDGAAGKGWAVQRAWRRMGQVRGSMRVVNTPAQASKVFQTAGLQRIIRFE